MVILPISNGEVHILERQPYALKKKLQTLLQNIEVVLDEKGEKDLKGVDATMVHAANDAALVTMVSKLIINGQETPVTIEVFDRMDAEDVELIINKIDEIAKNSKIPNA